MFASKFAIQTLFRHAIIDLLESEAVATASPNMVQYLQERKGFVDKDHLHFVDSESLTDHFQFCSGKCSYLRSVLQVCGVSYYAAQFLTMLNNIVGVTNTVCDTYCVQSFVIKSPGGEASYISCLKYNMMTGSNLLCYFPSFNCHAGTLITILPTICKMDCLYNILHRQGMPIIEYRNMEQREEEKNQKLQQQ